MIGVKSKSRAARLPKRVPGLHLVKTVSCGFENHVACVVVTGVVFAWGSFTCVSLPVGCV